jgi:hypothetical protein
VPAEVAGFLRDDPPAGQSLGALMVAGIAGGGGGGADPLSDGTPGGALPTRTLWIAGADGTVLRGLQADATGRLRTVVEGSVAVANFPDTQPVSGTVAISNPTTNPETGLAKDATLTTRLPPALNADGGLPTHVQNFPATQPVSLATNTPDVTDRAARLLGHVTVDNASLPVTGTVGLGTGSNVVGQVDLDLPTTARTTQASISAATSGDNTLVAGTAAQTIRVHRIFLVCNAAVNIAFKDGAATALTGTMNMLANGSFTLDMATDPWFVTTAGNAFVLNLSAAVQVSGRVYYTKS